MNWISDTLKGLFGQSDETTGDVQKTGTLTKEQLLRFFEAGHKMFDDPMVKLKLKEAAARRQNVDWVITEMQKEIFQSQGVDGQFGVGFLAKIRTVYADDAEMMQQLMNGSGCSEELALDEAELTINDFLKKLEVREWAINQFQDMQTQMKNMTPQQQREVMHQQQSMMKEVQKETQDIVKRAEEMDPEEKRQFIQEQVKRLQERFQIMPSHGKTGGSHSPHCHDCAHGYTASSANQGSMGSVMTSEEQAKFFMALYKSKR